LSTLLPQTLSVQRLFGVAVALKVAFAAAGYLLESPLWLGTVAPLTVMVAYMYLGYHRRSSDVSEERFADSCYYLGFIFTIVSIIICLFDLPKMSPGKGMYLIAMRFGAAMVSTVLGMIVRVYLVGFKKDVSEAVKDVETALIDATRAFTIQLQDTMQSMKQFEAQILDASKASVAGVQLQVESLGRNFADALNRFYEQVNSDNKTAFEQMLGEVRTATGRLSASVETYSAGMREHLQGIEQKVTAFSDAVTSRLTSTTFPDDFFSTRLEAPVQQLRSEAESLGASIRAVAGQVQASSASLGEVLDSLRERTEGTKATMDSVVALSDQHRVLLNNADLQLNALSRLAASLETLEGALRLTSDAVKANSATSGDLQRQIGTLVQDGLAARTDVKDALGEISRRLDQTAGRADGVLDRLDSHVVAMRDHIGAALLEVRTTAQATQRTSEQVSELSGVLPKLVATTEDGAVKLQNAVGSLQQIAGASTATAQAGAENARLSEQLLSVIREQTRELAAANQRFQETSNAQPAPIQTIPTIVQPADAAAVQVELPRPLS